MALYKRKTDRKLVSAEIIEEAKRKTEVGRVKNKCLEILGIND